jgi:hypothetical protein
MDGSAADDEWNNIQQMALATGADDGPRNYLLTIEQ